MPLLPRLVIVKIVRYFPLKLDLFDLFYPDRVFSKNINDFLIRIYPCDRDGKLNCIRIRLNPILKGIELIYDHSDFTIDNCGRRGFRFDRLYKYKCYFIVLREEIEEVSEFDAFNLYYHFEDLWEFFSKFTVIHEVFFKLNMVLSKQKKLTDIIDVFQKLSNQKEFLRYMTEIYNSSPNKKKPYFIMNGKRFVQYLNEA